MAIKVIYDGKLKAEYQHLFDTCVVREDKEKLVEQIVVRIKHGVERYLPLAEQIKCPWFFLGLIHNMECGLSFDKHLFNGDDLSARTIHVPKGYPLEGSPPFTFEQSALAALRKQKIDQWHDWTMPGILWQLEAGYNGLGYRQYHPNVLSPYLWSMTNHYTKGKYVADGKFDPNAVSQQVGCAALLKAAQVLGVFRV